MADEERKVLLKIDIDEKTAKKSTEQLDKSVEDLTKSINDKTKATDDAKKSGKESERQDKKSQSATDGLTSSVTKYAKALGPATLAVAALVAIGKGLLDSLTSNKAAMDTLSIETAALSAVYEQLTGDVGDVIAEMLNLKSASNQADDEIGFVEAGITALSIVARKFHFNWVADVLDPLAETAREGASVERMFIRLRDTQSAYNLNLGQMKVGYDEAIAATRIFGVTTEESLDILRGAESQLEGINQLQRDRATLEVEAAEANLLATAGTARQQQALEQLNEAKLKQAQVDQRIATQTRSLSNRISTEERKLEADRKKESADRIKRAEDERKIKEKDAEDARVLAESAAEEYSARLIAADDELQQSRLDRREAEAQNSEELIAIETERFARELTNTELLNDDKIRLEEEYQFRIREIRDAAAADEAERDQKVLEMKAENLEQGFDNALMITGALKGLNIENANFNKGIAITETIINTAKAIAASLPNLPLAALSAVMGAAQLSVITSQQFSKGGRLEGKSHAQGGININAEGGEAIINKHSMANPYLRSLASEINAAGGGKRFAMGGLVGSVSPASDLGFGGMTSRLEKAISASQPVLVTEDYNTVNNRVLVTEDRASIG